MKDSKIRLRASNIILLLIAGCINAAGVVLLLSPAGLLDSGISSLSMLLNRVTSLNIALFLIVLNVPLFIFGIRKMGVTFIIYSLIAIASYSLMAYVFSEIAHLNEKVYELISHDMLIAALFGGFLSGVGSGLTIRQGGAIDGVEVLAVTFAKKIGLSVGQFVMAFNVIIYTVSSIIGKSLLIGLYSVVSYLVGLKVIDFIVDGFDKGKACTIITKNPDVLAAALSEELGRGVTVLDCKGYFSNEEMTMLYCVANRFEITKIKKLISEIDPESFVAVNEVSEVLGNRIKFSLNTAVKPKQLRKKEEELFAESTVVSEEETSEGIATVPSDTGKEEDVLPEGAKDAEATSEGDGAAENEERKG